MIIDATQPLPFALRYFDVIFSVGAYNVFGDNEEMLPKLASYLKKGGYIAVSFPGLKYEFGCNVPPEMQPFWDVPEVAQKVRGIAWWKDLFRRAEGIEIVNVSEQAATRSTRRRRSPRPSAGAKIRAIVSSTRSKCGARSSKLQPSFPRFAQPS